MTSLKLNDDNKFQSVFNKKDTKSLEKRIESNYLKVGSIRTILDNTANSSMPIELQMSLNKVCSVKVGGYELEAKDATPLTFKHKFKHEVKMFLNLNGYKDNFRAKVVELAKAYRLESGSALKKYPQFQNDRDIVLAAVQKNGAALQYASDELKNDRVIVLAAVKQHNGAFFHASKDCQADPEIRKAYDEWVNPNKN